MHQILCGLCNTEVGLLIKLCEICDFLFGMSYPNFIQGLSFVDLFILASRLMVLNVNYSAKQMIIQCFDQEYEKIPKKRGKRVILGGFWTLARPG